MPLDPHVDIEEMGERGAAVGGLRPRVLVMAVSYPYTR